MDGWEDNPDVGVGPLGKAHVVFTGAEGAMYHMQET